MTIMRITCLWGDMLYLCMLTRKGWKCGRCLRGIMYAEELGCQVCGAMIHDVDRV